MTTALFAFLHHVAAFALVASLAVEFVLVRGGLTIENANRVRFADIVFGIAAGVILVVGLARAYLFEKGAAYYHHSAPFYAKMALFLVVGLVSIYPTMEFIAWGKATRAGRVPEVSAAKMKLLRRIIHAELAGVVFILLCAALMARGIGFFG